MPRKSLSAPLALVALVMTPAAVQAAEEAADAAGASAPAPALAYPDTVRGDTVDPQFGVDVADPRSEEHTSELQSLMRISYAVFCLKKKTTYTNQQMQGRSDSEFN